jgi:bifunctional DNase/RNase
VTELKDNTYFALIYLRVDSRQVTIDARPSDAISLALRTKSPIYVKKVLRRQRPAADGGRTRTSQRVTWAEISKMSPDDFKAR